MKGLKLTSAWSEKQISVFQFCKYFFGNIAGRVTMSEVKYTISGSVTLVTLITRHTSYITHPLSPRQSRTRKETIKTQNPPVPSFGYSRLCLFMYK